MPMRREKFRLEHQEKVLTLSMTSLNPRDLVLDSPNLRNALKFGPLEPPKTHFLLVTYI